MIGAELVSEVMLRLTLRPTLGLRRRLRVIVRARVRMITMRVGVRI